MKPKILVFDLETTPFKVWTFRLGEQVIRHDNLVDPTSFTNIICIGYKWLHEKKTHLLTWGPKRNTETMIAEFDKVASQADIIVGQNSDSFDVKHINTHRLLNNLPPLPAWFHMNFEDTKKMAKKYFNFPSNSLDSMAKILLQAKGKSKMEFQDWIDIVEPKNPIVYKKALDKMGKYCKKDVRLTAELYTKMAKYAKPKINMFTADGKRFGCIHCGGTKLATLRKSYTRTQVFQEYSCRDCKKYACRMPIGPRGVLGKARA